MVISEVSRTMVKMMLFTRHIGSVTDMATLLLMDSISLDMKFLLFRWCETKITAFCIGIGSNTERVSSNIKKNLLIY
jgi:hypothetical protein